MNRALLFVILAVVLLGGGGAWVYLQQPRDEGLDAAGQKILQRTQALQQAADVTTAAATEVLGQLRKHPDAGLDLELCRAEAWLSYEVGEYGKAEQAIHRVLGQTEGLTRADHVLAAWIYLRRHAQTASPSHGSRAERAALEAHRLEPAAEMLLLAWVVTLRVGDGELDRPPERVTDEDWGLAKALSEGYGPWLSKAREHAASLQANFGGSPQARLVSTLKGFPRGVAEGAPASLQQLATELNWVPEEVAEVRALKLIESGEEAQIRAGVELAGRVLETRPSSTTARVVFALGSLRLQARQDAIFHLEYLTKNYPDHPDARVWTQVLRAARKQG